MVTNLIAAIDMYQVNAARQAIEEATSMIPDRETGGFLDLNVSETLKAELTNHETTLGR